MKKLLLSTALVAATSVPVVAQNAEDMFRQQANSQELHASNFIGMRVYRADNVDAEAYEGVQEGWDDIGEINDVIISRDGNVEAVLVDIGGFLGIGENRVAVDMDSIRFVADSATAEEEADFFLILNAPRGALEEAPVYGSGNAMSDTEQTAADSDGSGMTDEEQTAETGDASGMSGEERTTAAGEGSEMSDEEQTTAETDDAATAEDSEDMAAASDTTTATGTLTTVPSEDPSDENLTGGAATDVTPTREGYTTAAEEQLTADALTGAAAFDANDQQVGEVSQLLLADDGKIEFAIVDVGGFLGIGEKPVQLEMSKLDVLTAEDGTDLRVYISMSEEQLEALPEYEN